MKVEDVRFRTHLLTNKGFRSESSIDATFATYQKKFGPKALEMFKADYGYEETQESLPPAAPAVAPSTTIAPEAQQAMQPAQAQDAIPASVAAAVGAPVAPGLPPGADPATNMFYVAKAQASTVAANAIANTQPPNIVPGVGGPISIHTPSTDIPFGNPLSRIAGYSGPRENTIKRGDPVNMGNAAPVKVSPQYGLPPGTLEEIKRRAGVVAEKDLAFLKEAGKDVGEAITIGPAFDHAKWKRFRGNAKQVWESHPTTAGGWVDAGQTYAWHAFNSWAFGAPSGARALWLALGQDAFWADPDNIFYTDPTAFGEAMGAVGDVSGMLISPGKMAAKVGKGVLKGAGKAIGKDIAGAVDDVLYSKVLGGVTRGVNKVNNWNPVGQLMQSADTALGRGLSRTVAPFGAKLVASEAGKTIVAGVAEIIGKKRMRTLLGSRSAEEAVERAASRAATKTLASEWKAVRRDPTRNRIENDLVIDTEMTALATFTANARHELGKVLGDADDATMQKLLDSMSDEFATYLAGNRTALGLLKHPFGSGRFATKLQSNKFIDITSRVLVDGALEGVGFGVQHLTASVGPYFEAVASEAYNTHEDLSMADYAKKTGELWFDKNFHHEREGNVVDPMLIGFVFGTKGLGVGHIQGIPKLPWLDLSNRNFSDLKRGLDASRGKGQMTMAQFIQQLGTDGHAEVLNRMVGIFQRAGLKVNPNAALADQLAKLFSVAEQTKTGRSAIDKAIRLMRGNYSKMTDKEIAMFAAISRANAERFPIIMRDGRMYRGSHGKIVDGDIRNLYDEIWESADDIGRLRARKNIEEVIEHENSIIEAMYKSESRAMFLSDLAKSSTVAGAIFFETGGAAMLEAMADQDMTPVEVANVMSHAMFSFMAGSHQRYQSEVPDAIRKNLDATKIGRAHPGWLQNRMRLSAMQAQLHYGGKDVHPFMAYTPPPIDYQSIHLIAATGSVNDFVLDIGRRLKGYSEAAQKGAGFHAVKKKGDPTDPENATPDGMIPLTHNELDQGLAVLKALVASGVPLGPEFAAGGYTPKDGQDYIDAVNNSELRAQYLGPITFALRNMAIEGKYLGDGGEFKAEHFYRMTRLSAQKKIGEIASAIEYTSKQLARLMSGIVPGKDTVISPVVFENNPQLTAQVADFIDMAATLRNSHEVFGGAADVSVKPLGDRTANAHQMGRNARELLKLPVSEKADELMSAGESAALDIINNFHVALKSLGVDPKLTLGTAGGELKNSLYDAIEMTGRFVAGELFHFQTDGGVVIANTNGKRLTVEGVIAAAEEAGLFSAELMDGASGKRILRPLSADLLKELSRDDPQKVIRLVWLHDVLSRMTDKVYTPTDETAKEMVGLEIGVEGNIAASALMETSRLSKLFTPQKSGANKPGDAYNPIYHKRGFWGALEDAGIVIKSREHAWNTISDLEGLKNMNLSESQRMTAAALKISRLIVKDAGGVRVLTPDVLIGVAFGVEDINGPEGVSIAAQALRNANGDALSPKVGGNYDPPVFGPAEKSFEFRQNLALAESQRNAQGEILNIDGSPMTHEQIKSLLFKTMYGVDLVDFVKMVDSLNNDGVFNGWVTDTGLADGKPKVIDTKMYAAPKGSMAILQEALSPLRGVSGKRRADMVENMNKVLRGVAGPQGSTTYKSVEQLIRYITSIGNAGDRTSMMRLRYLTEGVSKIVIEKDGSSLFTIKVESLTQEAMSKMLDRYEALELGRGSSVDIITEYQRMVDKGRDDIVGVSFLTRPEKNKGATFTHIFKEMRLGQAFSDANMERFREVATQLAEEFRTASPEDHNSTTPFVDELMRRFKTTFRNIGAESFGNIVYEGPLTKEQAAEGLKTLPREGIAPDAVERELAKLTRIDMIGLFDQVADSEVVLHLTASDAAAFDMSGVTLPEKGSRAGQDGPGETNVGMMAAPAPVGISRGRFSVVRKLRKSDITRQILDQLGGARSIELNMHDDKTNTSLAHNRNRLSTLSDLLYLHGMAKDAEPGKPGVIDETPDMNKKALKIPDRYGHENDSTPIVLVPFGDKKLLAIQVPKDRVALLTMMKNAKSAYDSAPSVFNIAKGRFDKLYEKLVDADGNLVESITLKDGSVVPLNSMVDVINAKMVSHQVLYNAFSTVIRANVHGTGIKSDSRGAKTYALSEALEVGSNKRYSQLASDSYRKISDLTFSMAINEAVERQFTTEADLNSRGFVRKPDGTWKIRVQLVAESEAYKRGGVKQLDGNIPVARGAMDVMAISGGFDPAVPRAFRNGMQWAGYKGFIFGSQGNGFNFLTKSFMTSMDSAQEGLALQSNVAMFVPLSSIKLGVPAQGAMYQYKGAPITFIEAAHRLKLGEKVDLIEGNENIIEISPNDLKFQAMHDPMKLTATITAQLTQGMSYEAIKDFLDDDVMFPAEEMFRFTSRIFSHTLMGQAEARAFYEKDGSVEDKYSPDDYAMGAMSLLDVSLMNSRGASATPMFQAQIRQRIMKLAKDSLFKGMSVHGGSAAMSPDASNSLKATEIILGPQARGALLNLKNLHLGVERTMQLDFVTRPDGVVVVAPGSREFKTEDADSYQQGTYGHTPRQMVASIGKKIGKVWSYNEPGSSQPSDSVPADKRTTWVDSNVNERSSVKNGHIRGFLAQVVAEVYAGGIKKGQHSKHLGPLYELFDRNRQYVTDETFVTAAQIVNDLFVDIATAKDADSAKIKIRAAQQALKGMTKGGQPIITKAEGDVLIGQLVHEMEYGVDRLFMNVEMRRRGLDPDFGTGSQAGRSQDAGNITNGDMFNLMDRVLGWRGKQDQSGGRAYDYSKRYVTEDGTDLYRGAGMTPVKYAITGALQRSPSAKVNDTVLFHQLGFMEKEAGGLAIVNRIDAVDAMEADYDYDTFKYMFALPQKTLGDVARLRNVIGPLGSQKDETKEFYTYLINEESGVYSGKNQYMEYIHGQHVAAALKGQIISGKAVGEKLIADGRGFTYTVGKKTYRITPRWDQDTMQDEGMAQMQEIYMIAQKVLDTPGSMLPKKHKLKSGATVDLNNFDVDREIFGRLYRKELLLVDGRSPKPGQDITRPEDLVFDDRDWRIMRSVRTLISKASSVMRDEQDGDTALSRNPDQMIEIANEYTEIFGDRTAGSPIADTNSKLRDYVLRTNRDMNENDARIIRGSEAEPGSGLQFFSTNEKAADGYVERVNSWVSRLGDSMNGEYKDDPTPTGDAKMIRTLATRASADAALINTLDAISRVPAIKSEIQRIEKEMKDLGKSGIFMSGQLDDLKSQLDDAVMARTHLGTGLVTPNIKTAEGRALNRRLVDGTVMGYALKLTALSIDDTLDPRRSAMADMSAADVIKARNVMWGIASGKDTAATNKRVKPTMIQDALNAIVENYMHQFTSGQEKTNMFNELAIRLLTPRANAMYQTAGQKFFSYEKMNQDIVHALMKYDLVQTQALLQHINRNSMLMSDVFSGDPVVGSLAMRDQIAAISSFDGRMGERRTMLRNVFKNIDGIDNPIEEMMKENLITRADFEYGYNPMIDGVLPAGTRVRGVDRMLLGSIRSQNALENYQGRIVDISVAVDRASILDIPGIKQMLGADWESARLTANDAPLSKAQRPFYRKLYNDAVEDVQTQVHNEKMAASNRDIAAGGRGFDVTPPNMIYLDGENKTKAVNQANANFSGIMSKVMAASKDMASGTASKAIFRDSRFSIRQLSDAGIESVQAERDNPCKSGGN